MKFTQQIFKMQLQENKKNTKDSNVLLLFFGFVYFSYLFYLFPCSRRLMLTIKIVFWYKNQPLSSLNLDALPCKLNILIFFPLGRRKLFARAKMSNLLGKALATHPFKYCCACKTVKKRVSTCALKTMDDNRYSKMQRQTTQKVSQS